MDQEGLQESDWPGVISVFSSPAADACASDGSSSSKERAAIDAPCKREPLHGMDEVVSIINFAQMVLRFIDSLEASLIDATRVEGDEEAKLWLLGMPPAKETVSLSKLTAEEFCQLVCRQMSAYTMHDIGSTDITIAAAKLLGTGIYMEFGSAFTL